MDIEAGGSDAKTLVEVVGEGRVKVITEGKSNITGVIEQTRGGKQVLRTPIGSSGFIAAPVTQKNPIQRAIMEPPGGSRDVTVRVNNTGPDAVRVIINVMQSIEPTTAIVSN